MPLRTCSTCSRPYQPRNARDPFCSACQRDIRSPSHRAQRDGTGDYERNKRIVKAKVKQCYWCGHPGSEGNPLTLEHVTAVAEGGTNEVGNLTMACLRCNTSRGAREGNRRRAR